MRKYILLFITSIVLSGLIDITAQSVKIKREAMSPGRLKISSSSPTWQISSGLRNIAKGMKVYLSADTTGSGSIPVTSFLWSFTEKPTGSYTNFDSTTQIGTTFTPDLIGRYIAKVEVNGGVKSHLDTFNVSTYAPAAVSCGTCHANNETTWKTTGHANMFKNGITGQLEVSTAGVGTYGLNCVRCHTVGWEKNVDNGNYGYLAKATGWDTTWYKTFTLVGTNVLIPYNDTTALYKLKTQYQTVAPMATIGCENCHGPGNNHMGDKTKIGMSIDAGVCLQCHDAPSKHLLGQLWSASSHATMPLSGASAASRSQCWPCHNGQAFVAYTINKPSPNYTKVTDWRSISCATCHDPHGNSNPNSLRTVRQDSLANGWQIPSYVAGKGQLCMNCHRARTNATTVVNNQYVKFGDRFYPHYSPQADMLLGGNFYNWGVNTMVGVGTHQGLENGCVTCHMQKITIGSAEHSNHTLMMKGYDSTNIKACQTCHGSWIKKYNDVKGSDYDGNGLVEGVQTEVTNLLNKLKSVLPKDSTGEVVTMAKDSMAVKNHPYYPRVLSGMYNYHQVKNDWSFGVHNTKLAVWLLTVSYSYVVTGVIPVELTSFTGKQDKNSVILKWTTATETNNKGFSIERKVNNKWETIGFVDGKGTTTEINEYSFVDKLKGINTEGKILYRLRQIDYDGTVHYSAKDVEINFVAGPEQYSLSQNYPNPFNPSTTIKYGLPTESKVKISLYNITGAVVKVLFNGVQKAGYQEIIFNSKSELSSGIYFYTIEAKAVDGSTNFVQTKKMVLMK